MHSVIYVYQCCVRISVAYAQCHVRKSVSNLLYSYINVMYVRMHSVIYVYMCCVRISVAYAQCHVRISVSHMLCTYISIMYGRMYSVTYEYHVRTYVQCHIRISVLCTYISVMYVHNIYEHPAVKIDNLLLHFESMYALYKCVHARIYIHM